MSAPSSVLFSNSDTSVRQRRGLVVVPDNISRESSGKRCAKRDILRLCRYGQAKHRTLSRWASLWSVPTPSTWIALGDGEIVGLIVLVAAEDHLLIENVAIDPRHQGKDIGRSLMALAEAYAGDRAIPELRLYTNAAMTENLALYSRLGYREYARGTENELKRVFFSKRLDLT